MTIFVLDQIDRYLELDETITSVLDSLNGKPLDYQLKTSPPSKN